jgi:DNA-binding MarR family transcriptional regulator
VNDVERAALIDELLQLEPELMRARFSVQQPPLLDIDVTMLQFKALMIMFSADSHGRGGVRVSDLAKCLNVSAATASTLVDRLVDRDLVERREDPQDRRQHRCRVAVEGQQLIVRFFEATRSQSRELLNELTAEELETLKITMSILIQAANRLRAAAGLVVDETCVISEVAQGLPFAETHGAAASESVPA